MKNHLPDTIARNLVDALKEARKSAGLSHDALARRAGISRAGLSFIESHKRTPTLVTCLKLARALNLRLADLLDPIESIERP